MRKKWWILAGPLALVIGLFIFLPGTTVVYDSLVIDRPYYPLERKVVNLSAWPDWWPGRQVGDSSFEFNGHSLRIHTVLLNGFQARFERDSNHRVSYQFVAEAGAKTRLSLGVAYYHGFNPIERLIGFLQKGKYKAELQQWLRSVGDFFGDDVKLYGSAIEQGKVTDSVLMAVKEYYDHKPSVQELYALVADLEDYIERHQGTVNQIPMLHIYKETETLYIAMVAMPTSRALPVTDRFMVKRMALGNVLKGKVVGGENLVKQCEENLAAYARDHGRVAPAIPYQRWITNRLQQPDSSAWITELYFPVFY
jgi:hypothetical protein